MAKVTDYKQQSRSSADQVANRERLQRGEASLVELERKLAANESRCTEVADDTDGSSATTMGSGMMAIVDAAQAMLL